MQQFQPMTLTKDLMANLIPVGRLYFEQVCESGYDWPAFIPASRAYNYSILLVQHKEIVLHARNMAQTNGFRALLLKTSRI